MYVGQINDDDNEDDALWRRDGRFYSQKYNAVKQHETGKATELNRRDGIIMPSGDCNRAFKWTAYTKGMGESTSAGIQCRVCMARLDTATSLFVSATDKRIDQRSIRRRCNKQGINISHKKTLMLLGRAVNVIRVRHLDLRARHRNATNAENYLFRYIPVLYGSLEYS